MSLPGGPFLEILLWKGRFTPRQGTMSMSRPSWRTGVRSRGFAGAAGVRAAHGG